MHVGKIIKIPNIAMRIGISFLVVALLPLLIVSLRAFYLSEQILNDEVMARLSAITDSKAHQIELFFSEEQEHISLLGRNPDIHAALKLFTEAFVKDGVDSSSYNTADETYRSLFTYFKQSFGVHDLFLISPAGDIVFSVLREEDFATNLKTGPYRDSALAKTVSQVEVTGKTILSGFRPYAPSQSPAAFIAAPIEDEGQLVGVIAIQLSIDELQGLAMDYTNLGETGEMVLASRSEDRAEFIAPLRHDPGAAFHRSVLIGSSEALSTQYAVQGQDGAGFSIDYRGRETLAIWRYLPLLQLGMVVKIDRDEAFARVMQQRYWTLIVMLVTLSVVVAMVLWLSRYISAPIGKLAKASTRIADGDLSVAIDIDTQDEIGQLADSFKQMLVSQREVARQAETIATGAVSKAEMKVRGENDLLGVSMNRMIGMFKEVVAQANVIAQGDYTADIAPRSDNDELSIALRTMTITLREISEENRKQDWFKTVRNELNDRMRGELDIKTLAHNIITYLAECLNVQIGALYLADEGGHFLQLTGGYAYTRTEDFSTRIRIGEGLAGQAAQEKKMMVVRSLPPDYVRIGSAIGDGLPRNVLVAPFLHEGKLSGVIEFGTFQELTDIEMELLQTVTDDIAIAFFSVQARDRLQELLDAGIA
jgi:GAF domain-containing protein/HAMP domain-containing protein